jgi:hypothetical protein
VAISDSKTIIRAVVPKTVANTIARMATVSGKSRSAIVAEFLTEAEPALRRLAGMLEVAKQQQSLFPKASVAELEAALDQLSGNATDVLDRVQHALQLPLEPQTRRAQSRSKRPGRAKAHRRKNPRVVTRG